MNFQYYRYQQFLYINKNVCPDNRQTTGIYLRQKTVLFVYGAANKFPSKAIVMQLETLIREILTQRELFE